LLDVILDNDKKTRTLLVLHIKQKEDSNKKIINKFNLFFDKLYSLAKEIHYILDSQNIFDSNFLEKPPRFLKKN